MDETTLQIELQTEVKNKLAPLFLKYHLDFSDLESVLKSQPIVLIIGNFSSGKSTLINELLGQDIQRTGLSPTDDAFTVITAGGDGDRVHEIPGSTLVNDSTLPFGNFKKHGMRFMSHFLRKKIEHPLLENMAIVDTPGMLDSVTQRGRGYDYLSVIGELANLADLVVLMFDPHNAGTIEETYTAIKSTLPEKSEEDRIIFVMNRVDDCDSLRDLIGSYGTLCWNLSQMTGRKDIPHVYLTYAPNEYQTPDFLAPLARERDQLKAKIKSTPSLRAYHILEDIDRKVSELLLICEAMTQFSKKGRKLFSKASKLVVACTILIFIFSDLLLQSIISYPAQTFLFAIRNNSLDAAHFILPGCFSVVFLSLSWLNFSRLIFSRFKKKCVAWSQDLVVLDSDYKKTLWGNIQEKAHELMLKSTIRKLWARHSRNLSKIEQFMTQDVPMFYDKIKNLDLPKE